MNLKFTESTVEEDMLEWTDGLAIAVLHGPDIATGEPAAERGSFVDVLLMELLRHARRQSPLIHRSRTGRPGESKCDDRLDGHRRRPSQAPFIVKKILKRHGYPPDKQAQATESVLKQAELLCAD